VVARDVGLEVVTAVACEFDSEALERTAPLPEGEHGLGGVVPMTTT
jgi:hypothetical protein